MACMRSRAGSVNRNFEGLSSASNYSCWPSSKVDMFMLNVSYMAFEWFLRTFTLLMWVAFSSYNSTLMRGGGGGSMKFCASALSHGPFFVAGVLVC